MVKSMGRKDIITKEYMEDTEVLEHFTSNFREVMQCQKYEDMVVNVIKENGYVAG